MAEAPDRVHGGLPVRSREKGPPEQSYNAPDTATLWTPQVVHEDSVRTAFFISQPVGHYYDNTVCETAYKRSRLLDEDPNIRSWVDGRQMDNSGHYA